ncbi:MAG: hypothetical protein J6Q22_01320 [Prevotella sp.]|nr:hypothetical protein [Prevotella sp.]
MKRLLNIQTLEQLMKIIITFIVAAFVLTLLDSCSEERLKEDEKPELKNMLPLCTLNQASENDMNIVFLPEGYTSDQMDVFMKEVILGWKILRQTKPYSHSMDKINVYYSTALASATDSLGSGHTAFALDSPKPLQASCEISYDSIMNVTKRLPFTAENTVLVIMVNVGGDIQLGFTLLPKPNRFLPKTVVIRSLLDKYPAAFTHEMGHAVGLLADEYYYQSENFVFDKKECQEMLDWQKEGYYLNVSASSNESEVFWSQFITDDAYSTENIGIYEGGKTFPKGVYRSTYNSVMRYHFQSDFYNAVDRYLIYCRIEKMHSGRDISYEEWRQIDLAHPQAPINWYSLTGGITRSAVDTPMTDLFDLFISESDVIIIP